MSNYAQSYFKIQGENDYLQNYYGNPNYVDGVDYENITLDDLGLNADLIKQELLGMNNDLVDPVTGQPYSDDFYNQMLIRAVSLTEKTFDIAILPRKQIDRLDYHRNDFNAFCYLNTTLRPLLHVEDMRMYYNEQNIMKIPDQWIKVTTRSGQIQVSPSILMQGLNTTINPTIYPLLNNPYGMTPTPYQQLEASPQMIGVTSIVGMLPMGRQGEFHEYMINPDVQSYVAKQAAIEILERFGRNIIGPGIASYSVSIDSINTSLNTTQSAENSATSAEIRLLQADMKAIAKAIRNYYGSPLVGFMN